jgi:hypothetical protein
MLTGGDALSSPEQRHAQANDGWGGITEVEGSSGTCTRGWKAGEVERGGDSLPVLRREAMVGRDQMASRGGGPFYRGEHRD